MSYFPTILTTIIYDNFNPKTIKSDRILLSLRGMITISVDIIPYVAEYISGKYYDASVGGVRFPPGSDIYHLIYDLLAKRPYGVKPATGNLRLALPDRRMANKAGGKSPEQYNYISAAGQRILERKMRLLFWAEVHDLMDENKHLHGINYKDTAWDFLHRYGIRSISDDGILKNYQRWRLKTRPRALRKYEHRKKR